MASEEWDQTLASVWPMTGTSTLVSSPRMTWNDHLPKQSEQRNNSDLHGQEIFRDRKEPSMDLEKVGFGRSGMDKTWQEG